MKNLKWLGIPVLFVTAHSALLFLTAIAIIILQNSGHQDTDIGFLMMCVTFYMVDYPIGILLEAARPHYSAWGGWLPTVVFLYGVLANLMWFLLGIAVRGCIALLPRRNHPTTSVRTTPFRNETDRRG